jgi:hypothetical protein
MRRRRCIATPLPPSGARSRPQVSLYFSITGVLPVSPLERRLDDEVLDPPKRDRTFTGPIRGWGDFVKVELPRPLPKAPTEFGGTPLLTYGAADPAFLAQLGLASHEKVLDLKDRAREHTQRTHIYEEQRKRPNSESSSGPWAS